MLFDQLRHGMESGRKSIVFVSVHFIVQNAISENARFEYLNLFGVLT